MRVVIKLKCSRYNGDSPRTWPFICNGVMMGPGDNDFHLPRVACVQYAMHQIVQHTKRFTEREYTAKVRHATDGHSTINWRFLNYPFNFNQDGVMRRTICIPEADLKVWKRFTKKTKAKKSARDATKAPPETPSTLPQHTQELRVEQRSSISSNTASDNAEKTHHATQDKRTTSNEQDSNVSPNTAFDNAMKALDDMNEPDHGV
jgi:hypothetical protein